MKTRPGGRSKRFGAEFPALKAAKEIRVMSEPLARPGHTPSIGEEIANSVSHGIGLLAAVAATPVLVLAEARRGSAAGVLGSSVFAAAVVL
jgi:hemolysin III